VEFTKLQNFIKNQGPIMVTGHTGFKGSWLGLILDHLEIDWIGYSLNEDANWIDFHRAIHNKKNAENSNVLDKQKLLDVMNNNRVSAVIHLAARPLVLESYSDPTQFFNTNIIGTSTVIEASLESINCRIVGIVTTDKVYLNNNNGRKFVETDQLWGNEPYSASKVGAELVTESWHKVADFRGTSTAMRIFRSGNVIGGGDFAENRLVPDLVRAYMTGQRCEIRNPLSTRPWLHVIDPLIGYLLGLQHCIGKSDLETFNFGPIEPGISVEKFAELFNQIFENQISTKVQKSDDKFESKYLALDSSKSAEALGWTPKLNQEDSIFWTAKWWSNFLAGEKTIETLINEDILRYFNL
jgi:CDP-glucose 4,6-dehydratase